MSSNIPKGSRSVAMVATASVDGYLRNASKRQRVPAAEGGRGTRRKLAMVTSAGARASATESTGATAADGADAVDADVDEWDEVDLPQIVAPVKKQETVDKTAVVKSHVADDDIAGLVKSERAGALPVVKTEVSNTVPSPSVAESINYVKAELVNVDEEVTEDTAFMDGAQLPLVGQPRSSDTWRQRDPAYEAMMEQRDLLAAQRRSERIQRVCQALFEVLAAFLRARLLWREAGHPRFLKTVLRLHLARNRSGGEKKRKCAEEREGGGIARYVFVKAVQEAKALVAEAARPQHRKLALAPAWVGCGKDTVQSKTSAAVKVLLTAINAYFKLANPVSAANEKATAPSAPGTAASATANRTAPDAQPVPEFTDWAVPLAKGHLASTFARAHGQVSEADPLELAHPLYFSLLFLALARLAGMRCRLVVAKQAKKRGEEQQSDAAAGGAAGVAGDDDAIDGEKDDDDDGADSAAASRKRRPLQRLSIFEGRGAVKAGDKSGAATAGPSGTGQKRRRPEAAGAGAEEVKSKKLPTSCFWVEVWSPERESFLSVNPCQGCATLWGAPYTFSVSGHVAVDATPRYTSKFSAAYAYGRRLGTCQQHRFMWHDLLAWDDNRELSEVVCATFNVAEAHTSALTQRQRQREQRQLHSLTYSEVVPTTLNALHRHPLYVIESDLARHEGVFPKDSTTAVGSVKGHMVYKRSAIVSLRSRDGWLREGRSLLSEDQEPYKVVAPPASRPFVAPSTFFGRWQTKPFEPLPLVDGDPPTIPHHGRTSWYILLDKAPPPGIAHMTQPQIARVARRMRLDFGLAVTGFVRRRTDEHRRGHWETVIDGIAVRESDRATLLHAYEEWVQLVQEQEAAKRRHRAFHWWLLLSQRLLSLKRLQDQYAKGLGAGAMPLQ